MEYVNVYSPSILAVFARTGQSAYNAPHDQSHQHDYAYAEAMPSLSNSNTQSYSQVNRGTLVQHTLLWTMDDISDDDDFGDVPALEEYEYEYEEDDDASQHIVRHTGPTMPDALSYLLSYVRRAYVIRSSNRCQREGRSSRFVT
eukprot:TRINITY_DN95_c0_g1_i1.p1 TRINITY_DN95_c0_g1~~TRINITY_DN95_c0_g1_i1.p1  ORF type:complete len:167 (-),score=11.30 TRINITY_DN95_c0_g1_i1:127-558(-)